MVSSDAGTIMYAIDSWSRGGTQEAVWEDSWEYGFVEGGVFFFLLLSMPSMHCSLRIFWSTGGINFIGFLCGVSHRSTSDRNSWYVKKKPFNKLHNFLVLMKNCLEIPIVWQCAKKRFLSLLNLWKKQLITCAAVVEFQQAQSSNSHSGLQIVEIPSENSCMFFLNCSGFQCLQCSSRIIDW